MWISYMGLDHELLDALHDIIDFWYNQLPRHHSLEQGKGRHAAARGLHVPKRPIQQKAQLLRARLPGTQPAQFSNWLINLEYVSTCSLICVPDAPQPFSRAISSTAGEPQA